MLALLLDNGSPTLWKLMPSTCDCKEVPFLFYDHVFIGGVTYLSEGRWVTGGVR